MRGDFVVNSGDVINIVVGQQGFNSVSGNSANNGSSGGGGSFIWVNGAPDPSLSPVAVVVVVSALVQVTSPTHRVLMQPLIRMEQLVEQDRLPEDRTAVMETSKAVVRDGTPLSTTLTVILLLLLTEDLAAVVLSAIRIAVAVAVAIPVVLRADRSTAEQAEEDPSTLVPTRITLVVCNPETDLLSSPITPSPNAMPDAPIQRHVTTTIPLMWTTAPASYRMDVPMKQHVTSTPQQPVMTDRVSSRMDVRMIQHAITILMHNVMTVRVLTSLTARASAGVFS